MTQSYDLSKLDPDTFEHMVNALVLAVLGAGATGFGPGSDGGRDGYFEGEAPYPSATDRWKGVWYIQSKFHRPHLSDDPQKWLLTQVKEELKEFTKPDTKRKWPENWIIATNIDQSGVPDTGAFDRAKAFVRAERPALEPKFHIWGGAKIIAFLTINTKIAERYGHFLTPGNILTELVNYFSDDRADITAILQQLVVNAFKGQRLTKLEQAGSQADVKPLIHNLFVDLPYRCPEHSIDGDVMRSFTCAARQCHVVPQQNEYGPDWWRWAKHPKRSRIWFIKGGPGQGKSTIGQYFCQIQRAALLLADSSAADQSFRAHHLEYTTAREIKAVAEKEGFWPQLPRIPLHVELKDYAQWYAQKEKDKGAKGILTFVCEALGDAIEQKVSVGTLKRALKKSYWVAIFDGLDEVPHDVKDKIAGQVARFINEIALEQECDLISICTSRPQGYSGQFRDLDCAVIELLPLPVERALACARPVISFQQTEDDGRKAIQVLEAAAASSSVRELLTTPLQAHILAVVVRDGERPPDRRWKLYDRFYNVIRRREANRNLPDLQLARLLREDEKLLKALHNRVGFRLQADAETSEGGETSLDKESFKRLAARTVVEMEEGEFKQKVEILDKATTERLVLISTPENGSRLRFDIRQLQEFFAAECLYESINAEEVRCRIALIAGDAHWREVVHFLLSSLVENDRNTELSVAIEELNKLNEGECEEAQIVARRAGKGALIAARLLGEGVLEQVKSTRQRFKGCLAPMAGFANVFRLRALIDVHHVNSRMWLFNFLFEKLNESTFSENIGAAIVLTYTLPDSDSRVSNLIQFLEKAPGSYVAGVIDAYMAKWSEQEDAVTTTWFCKFLVELLARSNWSEIGEQAVRHACWIVFQEQNRRSNVSGQETFDRMYLSGFLMPMWHEQPVEMQIRNVCLHLYEQSSRALTTELKNRSSSGVPVGEVTGVFKNILLAVQYSKTPSLIRYRDILRSISIEEYSILLSLYSALNVPIPKLQSAEAIASLLLRLEEMTDLQFAEWAREFTDSNRFTEVRLYDLTMTSTSVDAADIVACFSTSPALGLQLIALLSHVKHLQAESRNAVSEALTLLLPRLLTEPVLMLSAPWSWGILLSANFPDANELRDRFFEMCRKSLPFKRDSSVRYFNYSISTMEVAITVFRLFETYNEPCLLPYVTDILLSQFQVYNGLPHGPSDRRTRIPEVLSSRVRSSQPLLNQIMQDTSQCWSVRCSASLLLLVFREGSTMPIAKVATLFVENLNSAEGEWLLDGLLAALSISNRSETPEVSMLLRELFERNRNDYGARASLEHILMFWREASVAPVTNAKVRDEWLYRGSEETG